MKKSIVNLQKCYPTYLQTFFHKKIFFMEKHTLLTAPVLVYFTKDNLTNVLFIAQIASFDVPVLHAIGAISC